MAAYKLRIKFFVTQKGIISGEEKDLDFTLPNGHDAKLKSLQGKMSDSIEFTITSGGYVSSAEAYSYGSKIKGALLYYGIKNRVGIDVGKDRSDFVLGRVIKDEFRKEHNTNIVDDVHGLLVYSEEQKTLIMGGKGICLFNSRNAERFTKEVGGFLCEQDDLGGKLKLAMELVNSSYFEASVRSRFLSLVLAAESIIAPDKRPDSVCQVVDNLIYCVKESSLSKKQKESLKGSLNWLYNDSISQSLKKMAKEHLEGKVYDGLNPENFIGKCYDARSKLVHTGSLDSTKFNLGSLVAQLEVYMSDMLLQISKTKNLTNASN